MTSAPPTKVAAAATKGEVVVSADRQRMKLSRDAKNTVQPSAAASPIIRKSCGRTRSPASATPPSTIRTAPVISPACTGSSSSVIAIATDTSGAVPTTTDTLAAPESWIARKKSTCETPGANSPARKNANVSPSGTPSPAIAAASAQTTNPTNTLTSAPSSASPPCRRPILIATEVAPKRKAEAHARATAVTSGEPIRLARMERVCDRRRRVDRQPARGAPLARRRDRGCSAAGPSMPRRSRRTGCASPAARLHRRGRARPPIRPSCPTPTSRSWRRRRPTSRPPPRGSPAASAGAAVMTIQNGLGAEEIVRAHGAWPLLSAVTFMSGTKHGDAHVEYVLDTRDLARARAAATPLRARAARSRR